MRRKISFALAFLALIFTAAPVEAKNIVKIGRDINISENQQVDGVIPLAARQPSAGWLKTVLLPSAARLCLRVELLLEAMLSVSAELSRGETALRFTAI